MRVGYLNWFLGICLLLSQSAWATSPHCVSVEVTIEKKNIILPGVTSTKASQIYFLHNISPKSLWIDHPQEGKQSLKAGWSSFVQPDRWSAILINKKEFAINCAVIEPGKVNYQNCSKTITVCMPKDAKYDSKRKGSYWLAEDKSYEDLIVALEKRGIEFPKVVEPKKVKKVEPQNNAKKNNEKKNNDNKKQKDDKKLKTKAKQPDASEDEDDSN